ncbi:hypothetical protein CRYUN_Cryun09bG0067700 [Craigia yunnanensis]
MAESRDRITRAVDIAEVFARRRSGPLGILSDEAQELLGSPVQQAVTRRPMGVGITTSTARVGGIGRGISFGTPRSGIRRGRNLYRSTAPGRENTPMTATAMGRRRGRATGSVLPSWYPRTPLQDITAAVRVILMFAFFFISLFIFHIFNRGFDLFLYFFLCSLPKNKVRLVCLTALVSFANERFLKL